MADIRPGCETTAWVRDGNGKDTEQDAADGTVAPEVGRRGF